MLNTHETKMIEILALAEHEISLETMKNLLRNEDNSLYQPCPDEVLMSFLNGLIFLKRGKDPARPMPADEKLNNNLILKKLRVAFELKEQDIMDLLKLNGFHVSPHELSAFFRRQGHPNYRVCGDQFLRNILKSLTSRFRG